MANVGKIFEGEIRDFLKRNYALVGRESDVMGTRFISPKNFDFYACSHDGQFIAVEAKATKQDVFSFSQIKSHQREALSTVIDAGGRAFLALNMREQNGPGHAWLIPWGWFRDFVHIWPKKSIRAEEAAEQFSGFALIRITGGWEINRQLRLRENGNVSIQMS